MNQESNPFRFTFKDRNNKNLLYLANYSEDKFNITLSENKAINPNDSIAYMKPISNQEEARDVFYKNASFQDILKGIKINRPIGWPNMREIEIRDNDKEFLEQIKDNSILLEVKELRTRFICLVETARWGIGEGRDKAITKLRDYFIPKEKEPAFSHQKEALDLLKKLAERLSKEIRENLKFWNELKWAKDNWEETYKELPEHLNNRRILKLSSEDLFSLTYKPKKFAEKLLSEKINRSRSTFYNNLKQSNK